MRHASEVGAERIPAMRLLRRGLAASPELRKGAVLTLALALLAGGGRVVTPVLVQQTIDRHVTGGHGQHVAFDRQNNYPLTNLYLTMLHRLGIPAQAFSTATGTMRGLELA